MIMPVSALARAGVAAVLLLLPAVSAADPAVRPTPPKPAGAEPIVGPQAEPPHPPWATEVGKDDHGHWAEVVVKEARQRLRWIKPGTFIMGSPANEPGRDQFEFPHQVTLTKGYWLADSECTQAFWLAVTGSNPANYAKISRDLRHPVETVSWNDVQGFLTRMNRSVRGGTFCLPTEAQWEYACRAGTTGTYAGRDLGSLAWYEGNSGLNGRAVGNNGRSGRFNQVRPGECLHPVKQKTPNAWGLYDMHGGIFEWCADWFFDYPSVAVIDPHGPEHGSERTCRGGAWSSLAFKCRSAYRGSGYPDEKSASVGFRLCARMEGP